MNKRPVRECRIPVGQQSKLRAETRAGYVRRHVNDVDQRLPMFLDAGYAVVEGESSISVGNGIKAVLMEIPENFYKDDQAAKEQSIKSKEAGLLNDENGRIPENIYGSGISTNRPTIKL